MVLRWRTYIIRASSQRYRYSLLLSVVFLFSFMCIIMNHRNQVIFSTEENPVDWYNYDASDTYTINTEGCIIPEMTPFDEAILKYVEPPKTVSCPDAGIRILENNKTHIWVNGNDENLRFFNINSTSKLLCCYKSFYRPDAVEDIYSNLIDERIKYNECKYFNDIITVEDEFVKVSCFVNDKEIYFQYFLFTIKKDITIHNYVKEMQTEKPAYNVLVIGIDSISRMNFYRTMPKTLNFLRDKEAIEMMGYNKVADNSYPNLVPVLLGHAEEELKKICHPVKDSTYDDCPFIWHWYREAGFYTALGEDSAKLGTFNYLELSMNGFQKSPTDYYLHPFMREAEANAGNNKDFTTYLCMQQKFFYKLLLDYIEDLTEVLKSSKLFGFFWESTMSHDYLNYPMLMDEDYADFFRTLNSSKYLDDTIIFLISDHGIRWGPIRSTKQGRFEERLPFIFILTPPSFRQNYSEAFNNLKDNSRKLTTPFDLHETLNDLIDLDNIENEKVAIRSKESYAKKRGISWFLPVPNNRTCKTADIADHWCTCHEDNPISIESAEAVNASTELLKHLNKMILKHPQCVNLELAEIIDAVKVETTSHVEENDWEEYLVLIKTRPGGGMFEGTLRQEKGGKWTVTGTVSRLNLYGRQSDCVHDRLLKLYCFCDENGK